MNKVLIVAAARTPTGACDGRLKDYREQDLCVHAVKETIRRAQADPARIDELIVGIAKQTSGPSNCARYIGLDADLPEALPAYTVQRQSASGLQAILNGYYKIRSGNARQILAGGAESMSNLPYEIHNARYAFTPNTRIIYDPIPAMVAGSQPNAIYGKLSMSSINETIAREKGYTEQHQRDYLASGAGKAHPVLDERLIPLSYRIKKETAVLSEDEAIPPDGLIAGAADAASMCLMAAETEMDRLQIPLAEILSVGVSAGDPSGHGLIGEGAMSLALKKAGLSFGELGLVEFNEMTAAQGLAVREYLAAQGTAEQAVNRFGGVLDRGNPWGASGAVLLNRAVYGMQDTGERYSLLLCGAEGGQAIAMVLERKG